MKIWALFFVSVLCSRTFAQQNQRTPIRRVSAKEVKSMIDSSTGPMIVNFWASWCVPCVHEIPWFDSVIARKNFPVRLVLVSLDNNAAYPYELTAFVEKQGYKGEVFYLNDPKIRSIIQDVEPRWNKTIPASIFVNNANKYYQLFNEQIPKQRIEMELEKLSRAQ